MEFLMTYGWAILVVLIVMGVMMYSGFVDVSGLLPEKCVFPISVNCKDYSVKTDSISLQLENAAGRVMIVRNIKVVSEILESLPGFDAGTCELSDENKNYLFKKNAKHVFDLNMRSNNPSLPCVHKESAKGKNRYNIELIYSWHDSESITHIIKGEILVNVPK